MRVQPVPLRPAGVASGVLALAAALPLAAQQGQRPPTLASELRSYAELAENAEGWHEVMESDANAFFSWARHSDSIAGAEAAVARYLESRPDDPAALVLRARLMQQVALQGNALTGRDGRFVFKGQGDLPWRVRELLRRATEVAPGWAEPHYRLARVYLQPRVVEGPAGSMLRTEPDSALAAARRALDLDPRNRAYRVAVGEASLAAGDTATALDLLPWLEAELHLLTEIREDLDRIPVPPEAVEGGSSMLGVGQMMTQSLFRLHRAERVRSWLVPLTEEQVTAFYRESWEDFRFFTPGQEGEEADDAASPGTLMFAQHFRITKRRVLPARTERELDRRMSGVPSGVVIFLAAYTPAPELLEVVEQHAEFMGSLPRVEIVLVSLRPEPDRR